MGRCDYFQKECNKPGKCVDCLNPKKKPDMREKVREYIGELEQEIQRCVDWVEQNMNVEACKVAAMECRIQTLGEVKNDLKGRLEEVI